MKKIFKFSAIILAAGKSKRFKTDKLLCKYKDKLIIQFSIETFLKYQNLDQLIIVANNSNFKIINNLYKNHLKIKIIKVQTSYRHKSVLEGLKLVENDLVLIHDGARFNVDEKTINNVLLGLEKFDAAIPTIPCTNTIAVFENDFLVKKLNRDNLAIVQTPQGFKTSIIKKAMEEKKDQALSDCASYLNWQNTKIKMVKGHPQNIKLTFPNDLNFLI